MPYYIDYDMASIVGSVIYSRTDYFAINFTDDEPLEL